MEVNLIVKKLIIITGDLATGKSTFADILGQKYKMPACHKDTIKEVLSETFPFTDRSDNLKLSKAAMDIMNHMLIASAQAGINIILEANYHEEQIKEVFELAGKYGYSYLTIVLEGNIDILHQRYLNRIQNEKRHPVHLSTNFEIKENFVQYVANTRLSKIDGKVLKLNADTFDYQADTMTYNLIEEFLRE